jgi:hypothetical protein
VQAALKDLKSGKPDQTLLQRTMPLLADPAGRNTIRTAILTLDPFPSASMVALLHDSALAVRLGALELLEEKAGGDFGFNPWLPPGDPENDGPLARWQNWTGRKPDNGMSKDLLGEDQRRGYLRDLLGEDSDKSSRARRMLEADGLGAVGFLETFLNDSPTLPVAGRIKVREAQYQIVLSRPLGPRPPVSLLSAIAIKLLWPWARFGVPGLRLCRSCAISSSIRIHWSGRPRSTRCFRRAAPSLWRWWDRS